VNKPALKFESRKQRVAPLSHFFLRQGRYTIFALLLISISVFLGAVGYRYYAQLNWLDSFHMSCMILTGMGPVVEMKTTTAKLFSSFYALYSGIAFLSITAVFFTPLIHRMLHILHVEDD
jgi:hypothetical protein